VTLRPGVNAVRLAALLFGLAFLTFLSVHVVWLLLAGVLIGVALAVRDYAALRRMFPQVSVVRTVPPVVGRGDPFDVVWTIAASLRGALHGELRDEVPNCAEPRLLIRSFRVDVPASPAIVRETFVIPQRGRFQFGPLWLRLPGPLSMLDGQQSLASVAAVRVLPETYASPDRFRKEIGAEIRLLDKPVFSRQHGDGTEFESLKEYRPGDDPRRIDWRATARLQRPIVRKFQIERHRDVMIVIDCGRLMGSQVENGFDLDINRGASNPPSPPRATSQRVALSPAEETAGVSGQTSTAPTTARIYRRGTKLDCAVDSALLLARTALQGGDRCGFALFDHSLRGYLPPVSGLPAFPALVDCVYDAAVNWGESDFAPLFATLQKRQSKRTLLVIISDLLDAATSEQFRVSLQRLSQRHVVLFAALRTPLLNAVLRSRVESLEQAAEQAVTYRLLHDRDEALQTLRHGGLHVLDVEPQQLTAPLINEFIAIRRRNQL
jgi:uncharacterized protein (DUF58 family)